MFRLASGLASEVRSAKKYIRPIGCRFSWSSNYFGCEEFPFRFNDYEYSKDEVFLPCHIKTIPKNRACDVIEDDWDGARGFKYMPVMARAMYVDGMKSMIAYVDEMKKVIAGANEKDLLKGLLKANEAILEHLERKARMIGSSEEIAQVATVAANGDMKIVELVVNAMERVGSNGLFFISDKKKSNYELELFDNGMNLDWGLLSPFFFTDKKKETCILKNPLILIIGENDIWYDDVIWHVMKLMDCRRPLLVVVYDVEESMAGFLLQNSTFYKSNGVKLCIVKSRKPEEDWQANMKDLAILTGGQVVTSNSDLSFVEKMLGSCKEVRASYDKMVILGGSGGQANVEERCEQLRSAFKLNEVNSHYEVKLLEERHAKLSGCAAVIKVGGVNIVEARKKNKRVRNALAAAKAAMERGILPGGGAALLHASKELDKLEIANSDQKLGVKLLQHVLKIPVYSIASTAGFDGLVAVEKLMQQDNPDLGYDPAKGEYIDLIEAGNVDPLELILMELEDLVRSYSPAKLMSSLGNRVEKGTPYQSRLCRAQYNKIVS